MNREKQIDEICDIISEYDDCEYMGMATAIYNNGYRKMDKVTLKLDLGDRTPEEIQQIAEMFNGEIKKQVAKEILTSIKDIDDDGLPFRNYYWFERLCKQYGVEVDK